ncbi:MAG: hypothetical protein E7017_01590 [Alphaproteobacteria bacterium]|nr:hypothetical protein [Alphaproteobacteria bacterium]
MAENSQYVIRDQAYSAVILPLARQEKSVLYDTVFVRTDFTGKSIYQDQIGNWSMTAKEGTNVDTPANDPNLGRTRIDMKTYHDARLLDRTLNLQTLADPMSMASICVQSAVGVQIDTVIYGAFGGVAYRGENGETAVSFPEANVIAADLGGAGLNCAKLRRLAKEFDAKGIPAGDRYFAGGAAQKEQLLGTTEATSADYNSVRALVSGDINTFLGFKFKWLPDGIITKSGDNAECYGYHKTGVCFGMLEELFLRIDERKDKSYSKQVYYEISCGAGRLEEAKVFKVLAADTVTA